MTEAAALACLRDKLVDSGWLCLSGYEHRWEQSLPPLSGSDLPSQPPRGELSFSSHQGCWSRGQSGLTTLPPSLCP